MSHKKPPGYYNKVTFILSVLIVENSGRKRREKEMNESVTESYQ
jgi:hypothetical protein